MLNSSFSLQLHVLCLLAIHEEPISSEYIASSVNCNPVLVRKELVKLKKSKIIQTIEGKNGGALLSRKPKDIYLNEIFESAYNPAKLFAKNKNQPNTKCLVGKNINQMIDAINLETNFVILNNLHQKSLADFVNDL